MGKPEVIAERMALIGVGLIGGSLAKALKQAGVVGEVVGVARTEATLRKALDLAVIDRAEMGIEAAARGAGVVVIATPMQIMPKVLARLDACIDPAAVVTDVGSVKGYVAAAARSHMPNRFHRFVPGHPIAGREHAGVEAAVVDLYRDKTVILTPADYTHVDAVQTVARMWQHTGAQVQTLDTGTHDRLLAATSHLPHVVAYALVDYLAQHDEAEMLFELAAGGFYDFTRIASSDPVMWRDICLSNGVAVHAMIERFMADLQTLDALVQQHDGERLLEIFRSAKTARDRLVEK
jgi:prephenate dehydrogenase